MIKCAVIVTYEPEVERLRQLCDEIINQNFIVIIVDNSEINYVKENEGFDLCKIITLGANMGIAYAQNRGIDLALSFNAEIISFFDQDSTLPNGLLEKLSNALKADLMSVVVPVAVEKGTGMEYPSQRLSEKGYPYNVYVKDSSNKEKVDIVISSGMTTTASVIKSVGKYDEDFFIDFVDIEWCLRCNTFQIPIYVIPDAIMEHSIGENTISFLGKKILIHSPIRTYYKVRNSFLLVHKNINKLFSFRQIIPALVQNFILVLYMKKSIYLKFYFKGIVHGIRGVKGKYFIINRG